MNIKFVMHQVKIVKIYLGLSCFPFTPMVRFSDPKQY